MPLHTSKLPICLSWDPSFISISLKDNSGIICSNRGLKRSQGSETKSGSGRPFWDMASRLVPKHMWKTAHLLTWSILLRPPILLDSPCPQGNATYLAPQGRVWHSFQHNFLVAEPCFHYHILNRILKKKLPLPLTMMPPLILCAFKTEFLPYFLPFSFQNSA